MWWNKKETAVGPTSDLYLDEILRTAVLLVADSVLADANLGELQASVPFASPHRSDLRRGEAAQQKCADLAVLREQPVGFGQARRGADLRGFLTAARREQSQLSLPLQVDELGVQFAGDDHRLVEPGQSLRWEVSSVSR